MASFPSAVNPPGGASYNAPILNFAELGNLFNDYQNSQLNRAQLDALERQRQLAQTFQGGLPKTANGEPDYKAIVAALAQKGDIGAISTLAPVVQQQSQQQAPGSPFLAGGSQPATPSPAAPAASAGLPEGAPSASAAAGIRTSPQGDAGSGTIASMVTAKLPDDPAGTGSAIARVAQVTGLDPNAPLTAGQQRRVQGLIDRYAGASAPPAAAVPAASVPDAAIPAGVAPVAAAVPGSPASRVSRADEDMRNGGLSSFAPAPAPAAAVPAATVPALPAAVPAPAGRPAAPPPEAAQAAGPAAPSGPIVPPAPLPRGYGENDWQKASMDLRKEAARLASNPYKRPEAALLEQWADKIEQSRQPIKVTPGETLVDPRTSKTILQGPQAAMYAGANAGPSPTLDSDAERYRQTGTLPPNMGRGIQGQREARDIRQRATELEIERGGNPSDWPARWQDFRAEGVGKSAGERVRGTREKGLELILQVTQSAIPAALEQSAKVWRSGFVPLNKIVQHGQIMTSDAELRSFGMANLQLAEGWARAMNPTGVMRESDRDKALEFLSTADSPATYKRLVQQLQTQIERELAAVRSGHGAQRTPDPGATGGTGAGASPAGSSVQQWERAPDGTLRPAR